MAAVESETENKPFVLIARIHVKLGNVDQYLEIAAKVDEEVESSEPGMLFHNFDADLLIRCHLLGLKFTKTMKR